MCLCVDTCICVCFEGEGEEDRRKARCDQNEPTWWLKPSTLRKGMKTKRRTDVTHRPLLLDKSWESDVRLWGLRKFLRTHRDVLRAWKGAEQRLDVKHMCVIVPAKPRVDRLTVTLNGIFHDAAIVLSRVFRIRRGWHKSMWKNFISFTVSKENPVYKCRCMYTCTQSRPKQILLK